MEEYLIDSDNDDFKPSDLFRICRTCGENSSQILDMYGTAQRWSEMPMAGVRIHCGNCKTGSKIEDDRDIRLSPKSVTTHPQYFNTDFKFPGTRGKTPTYHNPNTLMESSDRIKIDVKCYICGEESLSCTEVFEVINGNRTPKYFKTYCSNKCLMNDGNFKNLYLDGYKDFMTNVSQKFLLSLLARAEDITESDSNTVDMVEEIVTRAKADVTCYMCGQDSLFRTEVVNGDETLKYTKICCRNTCPVDTRVCDMYVDSEEYKNFIAERERMSAEMQRFSILSRRPSLSLLPTEDSHNPESSYNIADDEYLAELSVISHNFLKRLTGTHLNADIEFPTFLQEFSNPISYLPYRVWCSNCTKESLRIRDNYVGVGVAREYTGSEIICITRCVVSAVKSREYLRFANYSDSYIKPGALEVNPAYVDNNPEGLIRRHV